MEIKFDFRNKRLNYWQTYNNIFFTSDWHFNHKNMLKSVSTWADNSGCIDLPNIEELNNTIIENINSTVGENDLLIMLGDVIFSKAYKLPEFMSRINCRNIKFLLGNHDNEDIRTSLIEMGYDIINMGKITIKNGDTKKKYWINHFPFADWDGLYTNDSYQIHGHTHGFKVYPYTKMYDAYIGTNNITPVSIETIQKFFEEEDETRGEIDRASLNSLKK